MKTNKVLVAAVLAAAEFVEATRRWVSDGTPCPQLR